MQVRVAAALALSLAGPALAAAPPTPVWPADPAKPVYITAHVDVTPQSVPATLAALKAYVAASRREPGAVRIEALQEPRPNHFDLIEVWADWSAYQAHAASPARIAFQDAIHPLRGSPFEERPASLVEP
jgi:quinol monooxygenase YgiN